jgi:hypothetical protein
MPRREKDRKLARRRIRKKKRQKLKARGLLPPANPVKEVKGPEKKKVEKTPPKEAPEDVTEKGPSEG